MKYRFLLPLALVAFLFTFALTSCTSDASTAEENDNFVNKALDEISAETRTGKSGCFEIVFPVTVVFADSTTVEVGSYVEMKAAFKTWKENNPEVKGRPRIQFPFFVTKEDGTVAEIKSAEELKALTVECIQDGHGPGKGNHGPGKGGHGPGKGDHGSPCFTINFPVTVLTSKGEVSVANPAALKEILKMEKGSGVRPQFVFPISVTMEDGTIKTIDSAEALKSLKKDCRG